MRCVPMGRDGEIIHFRDEKILSVATVPADDDCIFWGKPRLRENGTRARPDERPDPRASPTSHTPTVHWSIRIALTPLPRQTALSRVPDALPRESYVNAAPHKKKGSTCPRAHSHSASVRRCLTCPWEPPFLPLTSTPSSFLYSRACAGHASSWPSARRGCTAGPRPRRRCPPPSHRPRPSHSAVGS